MKGTIQFLPLLERSRALEKKIVTNFSTLDTFSFLVSFSNSQCQGIRGATEPFPNPPLLPDPKNPLQIRTRSSSYTLGALPHSQRATPSFSTQIAPVWGLKPQQVSV